MSVLAQTDRAAGSSAPRRWPAPPELRRAAPTLAAGALAAFYVIVSPPSLDLTAHLFRAKLFATEGFGLWDNWWYAGHHTPGYSVLFPPLAAATSPQLAAAIAATATAALFEALVHRHFGRNAWLGALWFGVATAANLYTGRLTFAFGVLPGVASALALQRGRPVAASGLALLSALASPVAALFVALIGAAHAAGRYSAERRWRAAVGGLATAAAALVPVMLLAVMFPEGGSEPFIFMTLWPIPLICLAALYAFPRSERAIWAGAVMYALACLAAYLVPTPAGSNVARLAPFAAGPMAALALWPRRKRLLAIAAIPLLYLLLQAPIRDVSTSVGDPSGAASYWQPLLSFLGDQGRPPFRVEIPFTQFHWEAFQVAPRFSLARGWERQLDIEYNGLFYAGRLTPERYAAWLHRTGIRFVAASDARLDYSAHQESALIGRGLPYLRLVRRTRHWRIYAVRDPTPLVQGAATLVALGPNSLALQATRAGSALVRVRFTPYWALSGAAGCVGPQDAFTKLTFRRPGRVALVIRFSLSRIGARSPRCTSR